MAINHKIFELKKEHIALIKCISVDKLKYINQPKKLQKEGISPFGGDTLIGDLAEIIIGAEPFNNPLMRLDDTPISVEDIAKTIDEYKEGKYLSRTTEGIEEYLLDIYNELPQALEIVFSTTSFEPGIYRTRHYMIDWRLLSKNTTL